MFKGPKYVLKMYHQDFCVPEIFNDVKVFELLHLECQLIQSNLKLALNIINNVSRHFRAISPNLV